MFRDLCCYVHGYVLTISSRHGETEVSDESTLAIEGILSGSFLHLYSSCPKLEIESRLFIDATKNDERD